MDIKSVKKMVMPEDGTTEFNTLEVTDTSDKIYFVPKINANLKYVLRMQKILLLFLEQ